MTPPSPALGMRILAWLLVTCALGASGCETTQPLRPVAEPAQVASGEGILVLHVRTGRPVKLLEADGLGSVTTDLPAGEHVLFLAASPGRYRWTRVVFPKPMESATIGGFRYRFRDPDYRFRPHELLNFDVVADHSNYVGILEIAPLDGHRLLLQTVNRGSRVLPILQRDHRSLLERFPLRWAGPSPDPYFERYVEAQKRQAVGSPDRVREP